MPRRKPRHGHGKAPAPASIPSTPAHENDPPPQPVSPPPSTPPLLTAQEARSEASRPVVPSARLSEALDAVMAESVRRVAVATEVAPPVPMRVPSHWLAAALGSWLVFAALLVLRPAIAQGPVDHPWQPDRGMTEASLRYGMWLARGRIEGFTSVSGRLPSFIGEAGVTDTALVLVVTGEREYHVEGRSGQVQLRLERAMNADSFLGESLSALRRE
jgi:hypothetical protein